MSVYFKLKHFFIVLIFILVSIPSVFGQSDYQIKQDFLKKHKSIENAISHAQNSAEIEVVQNSINGLESDFKKHEKLLDKSLYPDNFNSSLTKLRTQAETMSKSFVKVEKLENEAQDLKTKVDSLSTEVADLKKSADELVKENIELKKSLNALKYQMEQSKKSSSEWKGATVKYQDNIQKRDALITKMISSIFEPIGKDIKGLADKDREQTTIKIESLNVLDNIKNLITDNMALVELGSFKPEEYKDLRKNRNDFQKKWKEIQPKLEDVYGENVSNHDRILAIDTYLQTWDDAINRRIWKNINTIFYDHSIKIKPFNSGEKMVENILDFIDSMMKSKSISRDSMKRIFYTFRDTCFSEFNDKWFPLLSDQNMMSSDQRESIKTSIKSWEKQLGEGSNLWLYILIAILLVAVAVLTTFILKIKKKIPPTPAKGN